MFEEIYLANTFLTKLYTLQNEIPIRYSINFFLIQALCLVFIDFKCFYDSLQVL